MLCACSCALSRPVGLRLCCLLQSLHLAGGVPLALPYEAAAAGAALAAAQHLDL